jgi:hypothetical protein
MSSSCKVFFFNCVVLSCSPEECSVLAAALFVYNDAISCFFFTSFRSSYLCTNVSTIHSPGIEVIYVYLEVGGVVRPRAGRHHLGEPVQQVPRRQR